MSNVNTILTGALEQRRRQADLVRHGRRRVRVGHHQWAPHGRVCAQELLLHGRWPECGRAQRVRRRLGQKAQGDFRLADFARGRGRRGGRGARDSGALALRSHAVCRHKQR